MLRSIQLIQNNTRYSVGVYHGHWHGSQVIKKPKHTTPNVWFLKMLFYLWQSWKHIHHWQQETESNIQEPSYINYYLCLQRNYLTRQLLIQSGTVIRQEICITREAAGWNLQSQCRAVQSGVRSCSVSSVEIRPFLSAALQLRAPRYSQTEQSSERDMPLYYVCFKQAPETINATDTWWIILLLTAAPPRPSFIT